MMFFAQGSCDLVVSLTSVTDGRGIDLAFDPVGAGMIGQYSPALAKDARILICGTLDAKIPTSPIIDMFQANAAFCPYSPVNHIEDFDAQARGRKIVRDALKRGLVAPRVDRVYPMEGFREAWDHVSAPRETHGKVVVETGAQVPSVSSFRWPWRWPTKLEAFRCGRIDVASIPNAKVPKMPNGQVLGCTSAQWSRPPKHARLQLDIATLVLKAGKLIVLGMSRAVCCRSMGDANVANAPNSYRLPAVPFARRPGISGQARFPAGCIRCKPATPGIPQPGSPVHRRPCDENFNRRTNDHRNEHPGSD